MLPTSDSMNDDVYAVKRSHFLGKPVSYICQNINGPCPLLAISNLLLLRGHISIDAHLRNGVIAASDLLVILRKRLVDANPPLPESDELGLLTQQKTIAEVYDLMPSLLVGLDVNVRFHSITDFEYTAACAVFDMLDIALVHGWLLDIQDEHTLRVVQNKSYNELIERLVDYRGVMMTEETAQTAFSDTTTTEATVPPSQPTLDDVQNTSSPDLPDLTSVENKEKEEKEEEDSGDATEALAKLTIDIKQINDSSAATSSQSPRSPSPPPKSPSKKTVDVIKRERHLSEADAADTATALLEDGPILEEFFTASASQLTYYGLVKLHEDLRERQLSVFFRNNHFSTLFKHDGALYLLVTDAGYLDEPTVVWERLNEIDGDTAYYDEHFRPLNASETRQQTILQQQEEARRRFQEAPPATVETPGPGAVEGESASVSEATTSADVSTEEDPDYLLALKLQQEEEALANARRQPQPQSQAPSSTQPPSQPQALTSSSPQRAANSNMTLPHSPIRYTPREPSEGYDSQPPSQGPHSSSEGDTSTYAMTANGELVLSEAELQAQQQAALYYEQQRQLQQTQSQGHTQGQGQSDQYAPPHAAPAGSMRREYDQQQQRQSTYVPPTRGDARRQSNDCCLM